MLMDFSYFYGWIHIAGLSLIGFLLSNKKRMTNVHFIINHYTSRFASINNVYIAEAWHNSVDKSSYESLSMNEGISDSAQPPVLQS